MTEVHVIPQGEGHGKVEFVKDGALFVREYSPSGVDLERWLAELGWFRVSVGGGSDVIRGIMEVM